ncbi:MAG: acyl-CoA dehydrogenase, partial [Nocardioidaceae bacterium]
IEQYIRDAKIDSLYEGTTGVQSQDFFFRKIVRDNGRAIGHVNDEIQVYLDSHDSAHSKGARSGNGRLKEERALLATALGDLQAMLGTMIGYLTSAQEDPHNTYKVAQHTVRFLDSAGDVLIGWLLLRQADVALAALSGEPSERDRAFYEGKVGAASFFAKTVLPELTARRAIVESADNALMDLSEDAF